MPSYAAQVIISVIPIVGIVMGSAVLFFYFLWTHKERMALIERGLYESGKFDLMIFSLLAGLLLSGVGIALTAVFLALDGFGYPVIGGLLPLAIGLGLLTFYGMAGRKLRNE